MDKNFKIRETELKIIYDMTLSGASRGEIAKAIRCSKMTVYRYQKKLGLI